MLDINKDRRHPPYVRLPENCKSGEEVADLRGWLEYWIRYLGGLPPLPKMFMEGHISALSVPEEKPELFDPTFERDPKWRCPRIDELQRHLRMQRSDSYPIRPIERNNLKLPDGRFVNYNEYLESHRGRIDRPLLTKEDLENTYRRNEAAE